MTQVMDTLKQVRSLYHELWTCAHCGRQFGDATACCTHEQQCGQMTHC
jgi:hypothetical protein